MPVPDQGPRGTQPPPRQTHQAQGQNLLPQVKYFENDKLRPELLDEELSLIHI